MTNSNTTNDNINSPRQNISNLIKNPIINFDFPFKLQEETVKYMQNYIQNYSQWNQNKNIFDLNSGNKNNQNRFPALPSPQTKDKVNISGINQPYFGKNTSNVDNNKNIKQLKLIDYLKRPGTKLGQTQALLDMTKKIQQNIQKTFSVDIKEKEKIDQIKPITKAIRPSLPMPEKPIIQSQPKNENNEDSLKKIPVYLKDKKEENVELIMNETLDQSSLKKNNFYHLLKIMKKFNQ